MDFDHILNWLLLEGSHDFPGPDGGTCINEAAIVAAGFEYRAVTSAHDCPPCFSRPLAEYLIGINDAMPDDERQKLLRFVMRLSGSADTLQVERRREEHMCLETIRRVLPVALRAAGLHAHAKSCAAAPNLSEGKERATKAADASVDAASYAADAASAERAADAVMDAASVSAASEKAVWAVAIEIAEEAFAIGRQADLLDVALVSARLEEAKAHAAADCR